MTDGAGQAPAGWYDDPHSPGQMRYFDGEMWTNHFHSPGSLPDIGSWIGSTFTVFRSHWIGAILLALGTGAIGTVLVWIGFWSVFGDLAVVDEELVGFKSSSLYWGGALFGLSIVWQAFSWLALNRYLQMAHFQAGPTVADALTRALSRLPKFIAVVLPLLLLAALIMFLVVVLAIAQPALGVLFGLVIVIGMFWVWVKLSFLTAAVAAAPSDTPMIASSAGVSTGRYWPVFGRVLLLAISLAIASNVLSAVFGGLGSPVEQDVVNDLFVGQGSSFKIRDFTFDELLPGGSNLIGFIVVSALIRAASTLVSTSALMRLYLDSGAPSDL